MQHSSETEPCSLQLGCPHEPPTPMLAGFPESPVVRWASRTLLELTRPLEYIDRRGVLWTVPERFQTDLASVPRVVPGLVRLCFGSTIETARAAILHDWLYATGRTSRREADDLFREALLTTGESPLGAFLMWSGVRLFGWIPWRKHRSPQRRSRTER